MHSVKLNINNKSSKYKTRRNKVTHSSTHVHVCVCLAESSFGWEGCRHMFLWVSQGRKAYLRCWSEAGALLGKAVLLRAQPWAPGSATRTVWAQVAQSGSWSVEGGRKEGALAKSECRSGEPSAKAEAWQEKAQGQVQTQLSSSPGTSHSYRSPDSQSPHW